MNSKEFEEELWISRIFKRPPCTMILDPPFYPWLPPEPIVNQPLVNFSLNFSE